MFYSKKFELLSTRAGRAGVIHNFMRGLSLQESYPLSPFSPLPTEAPSADSGVDVDNEEALEVPNPRVSGKIFVK